MRPTRQLWVAGALAAFLAVLAVVFARPLLLVATAMIGAWILSRQYLFIATLRATIDSLDVTQTPAMTGIRTNGTTTVALAARLDEPRSLACTLEAGVPPGGRLEEPLTLSLTPGDVRGQRTADVDWPIAGRHRFEQATLTATDGLFETTVDVGNTPTVTVEPRGPRTVHVGEGGGRVAIAQGDHESGGLGSGLEPAELREYVPGDRTDRIDWNTTARLATLYVREYDTETDRPTMLCIDHRDSLSMGPPGETKLDYLREVALAITASARNGGDPIGLFTVAEEGVTTRVAPAVGPAHYTAIRRQLLDLEPHDATRRRTTGSSAGTDHTDENAARSVDAAGNGGLHRSLAVPTVTQPRDALSRLDHGDDAFARTLEPFYSARRTYSARFESDPLLGAVQAAANYHRGQGWTVLCTDDSEPETLRAAVRQSRERGREILVLLAPTVLFEPGGLADVERAYERYVAFEELRRELDSIEQVTALEVAPGDRLSSVLAAGRGRTRGGRR